MSVLSRRQFQFGAAAALGCAIARPVSAADGNPDSRVAIIDTDDDIHKMLSAIGDDPKNGGLEIVARYYARDCQPNSFPYKRFAMNEDGYTCGENRWSGKPEHELILSRGLAILSVYQFSSSDPSKFLFGLRDLQGVIRKSHKPPSIAAPEAEAEADATAVLDQANSPSSLQFTSGWILICGNPVR